MLPVITRSAIVSLCVGVTGVPTCSCGGRIKPDVVLYEEGLDQYTLQEAVRVISEADMLIIGGTSLAVYPAAGLIDYYQGNRLVLINKTPTQRDTMAPQEQVGTPVLFTISSTG